MQSDLYPERREAQEKLERRARLSLQDGSQVMERPPGVVTSMAWRVPGEGHAVYNDVTNHPAIGGGLIGGILGG